MITPRLIPIYGMLNVLMAVLRFLLAALAKHGSLRLGTQITLSMLRLPTFYIGGGRAFS